MGGEDRGKERGEDGRVMREGGKRGEETERKSFPSFLRLAPDSFHNSLK